MHKRILRIISLALAIMLLISVFPTSVSAAADDEVARINNQIRTLYRQTLRGSGKHSLHGYCGTMVNWHLYLLGITATVNGNDGNTQYDHYCRQEYTSGGYRVRPYSANDYTLEEALNAITYDGTRDVYNLVVGFERTNTSAGRRYGHALVIQAILDGVVYFSESFGTSMNGKYYPEGSPIACSIAEFAEAYDSWTVFEGVLYFGLKTYAESCEYFPSYLNATITATTPMCTAPCMPDIDDRSTVQRTLNAGERVTITGLYRNTEGEYWYQVEDLQPYYIPADNTEVLSLRYDDILSSGVGAPTVLRAGNAFDVKGKIKSTFNEITSVRVQVFACDDLGKTHVMSCTASIMGNSYSLSGTRLSNQLAFRKLAEGNYRFELAAVVGNHYYADGSLQAEWKTVKLWTSDFQVVKRTSGNCVITFDANGGTTDLNAMDMAIGTTLDTLPEASREGYIFTGWYTEDGQKVNGGYEVDGKTTFYAQWTNATDLDGWYTEGGVWYYYENGVPMSGFLEIDGIRYHLNAEGYLDTGLLRIDGALYYFHANGAMHFGWLELDDATYYMGEDGTAVTGFVRMGGNVYRFDANGVLQTDFRQDKIPLPA